MQKRNQTQNRSNTGQPKADAFLNIRIKDADGNMHSFKSNIALYSNRALDRTLINATDDEEGTNSILDNLDRDSLDLSVHIVQEQVEPNFGNPIESANDTDDTESAESIDQAV